MGAAGQPIGLHVAKDTPKLGSLFYQINGGMDAGHHRFLPTNAKLDATTEAAETINAWLDQVRQT